MVTFYRVKRDTNTEVGSMARRLAAKVIYTAYSCINGGNVGDIKFSTRP